MAKSRRIAIIHPYKKRIKYLAYAMLKGIQHDNLSNQPTKKRCFSNEQNKVNYDLIL